MNEQTSLLTDALEHRVSFKPTLAHWRAAARMAINNGWPPNSIFWDADPSAPAHVQERSRVSIPRPLARLLDTAQWHRSGDRWSLFYRIVWRSVHDEPQLWRDNADPDIVRLSALCRHIRRDIHKMHAFVRFHKVTSVAEHDAQSERFVAWFEPEHLTVQPASGFFQRRFAHMRWSILTPDTCAHYEGTGSVWFSEGAPQSAAPREDQMMAAWKAYYRSTFNPARLKMQAMMNEMPRKYWKNLPEAALITELEKSASQRTGQMLAFSKEEEALNCGPRPVRAAKATVSTDS